MVQMVVMMMMGVATAMVMVVVMVPASIELGAVAAGGVCGGG